MNLGEKIYYLRKKHGLSQEQLAEVLGVSRQAVSKWEAGQSVPDIDKILSVCDCFSVSADYLLRDIQNQTENEYAPPKDEAEPLPASAESCRQEQTARRRSALMLACAVMMYILCIVPPILIDGDKGPALMFVIAALATGLIIYRAVTNSKKHVDEKKEEISPLKKALSGCVWTVGCAAYFIISFSTGAWHITWLVFPITSAVCGAAIALIDLKGENTGE